MSEEARDQQEEIVLGELTAWRCWFVCRTPDGTPFLRSISMTSKTWMPNEPMRGDIHKHGNYATMQGVYSFNTLETALVFGNKMRMNYPLAVLGQVELWGRVAVHRIGYRASFMLPKSFDYVRNDLASPPVMEDGDRSTVVQELRRRYLKPEPGLELEATLSWHEKVLQRFQRAGGGREDKS